MVTQVEAIMNSRLLTPISSDLNDLEALTPGHFLIGRQLNCLPEPADEEDNQINCSNRWKRIQAVQKSFWSRWKREYLVSLQERQKWLKPTENIKIGSLVLIQEDNLTRTNGF